jgi:hypothetical protein
MTEPILWWNAGEVPLVGRGIDGMIYVVSTFVHDGSRVSCIGSARAPSLDEALSTFAAPPSDGPGSPNWVSHEPQPVRPLREDILLHKALAERAAADNAVARPASMAEGAEAVPGE